MAYQVILFTDMIESVYHFKSLGAYNLATVLRNHGYSTLVVDHFSRYMKNPRLMHEVVKSAVGPETLVIGFSSTFFSNKFPDDVKFDCWENFRNVSNEFFCGAESQMALLQKVILSQHPKIKFVYGGHSAQREQDLSKTQVKLDYVIKGYAEHSFLNLVQQIERGTRPLGKTVNGITFLESVPEQFEFRQHMTRYEPEDVILPGETLALETSRGCMYNCTFCAFPLRNRKRGNLDYHSHEDLLYEYFMENYQRYGVVNYTIVDDTFNETTDKLRRFRDVVKRTGLPLQFMSWIRLDLLGQDLEQLDLLLEAGVRSIWLGVETLNEPSLRSIRKNYTSEFAKQTLAAIRDRAGPDFRIYGSFIIGLPHETPDTVNDWMSWIIDQSPIDCIEVICLNIDKPETIWPSEISVNPEAFGYTKDPHGHGWRNEHFTRDQAQELTAYYNNLIWQSGRNRLACFDLFGIVNHGYTFDELKDIPINQLPFDEILERGRQRFQQYHAELVRQIGVKSGIEPWSTVSQTVVLPLH